MKDLFFKKKENNNIRRDYIDDNLFLDLIIKDQDIIEEGLSNIS